MIRAVVVDDEPIARSGLIQLLAEERDVEVVGEAEDGDAAVAVLRDTKPDIVFLDIQMPGLDGLAVAEALQAESSPPVVVFVTAYDEYAVRAFEVEAVDYLLKPFDRERLGQALARTRSRIRQAAANDLGRRAQAILRILGDASTGTHAPEDSVAPPLDRIVIREAGTVVFLRAEEIDRIEAAGNYVRVFAGGRRHLVREPLTAMEAKLDARRFVRVSRSAIVNLARVREVRPQPNGTHLVRLEDGTVMRASRRYGERLRRAITRLG